MTDKPFDPEAPYGRSPVNGQPLPAGLRDPVVRAKAAASAKASLAERKRRSEKTKAKVNNAFLDDVLALWRKKGPEILEQAAAKAPEKVMKIVADLIPKQMEIKGGAVQDLDDEKIEELIGAITRQLGRGVETAAAEAASRAGAQTIDAEAVEIQSLPKAT